MAQVTASVQAEGAVNIGAIGGSANVFAKYSDGTFSAGFGASADALFGLKGGLSVNVNAQSLITNVTNSVVNVLGNPATNPFAPAGEYIGGTPYNWTH